jgi:hypothetical protein
MRSPGVKIIEETTSPLALSFDISGDNENEEEHDKYGKDSHAIPCQMGRDFRLNDSPIIAQ